MSNEMTLFGGKQLPAHLQNLAVDATTKALAGAAGGGRRISIKGSVFRMIEDGKQVAENEDRAMNIVVVAAAPSVNRQYYAAGYVEGGEMTAPDCFSSDGVAPDADASTPQSANCASCQQNIAGSGQGESRACRFQQRLAIVLEGDIGGPVYQLPLPATSLFGKGEPNNVKMPLQAYARYLASHGLPITAVVTEMRFDTAVSTPKLTFKAVRPLTEEEYAISQSQGASNDALQAVKLSVFKQDTKNAPKAEAPVAKPVAKAAPAAQPEAEPVSVAKPKPAAPAAKRPVADVIAEWDE